jgi:hypothetical protein
MYGTTNNMSSSLARSRHPPHFLLLFPFFIVYLVYLYPVLPPLQVLRSKDDDAQQLREAVDTLRNVIAEKDAVSTQGQSTANSWEDPCSRIFITPAGAGCWRWCACGLVAPLAC